MPLLAWVVSRALVVVAGVIASEWLGKPGPAVVDTSVPRAMSLLGTWDTGWYIDIARIGYTNNSPAVGKVFTNLAFFPGLPLIMRVGLETGGSPFVWGFVASNLAFLVALIAFHELSEDRRGRPFADRTCWVLALAPPAVFASLAYTDAILLALATAASLAATRGRWITAAVLGALAVLVRPQGLLVVGLVVLIALTTSATLPRRLGRAAVASVPAILALGGFFAWMQVYRGAWDLPIRAQGAWQRTSPGLPALRNLWGEAWGTISYPFVATHPRLLLTVCGKCSPTDMTGPYRDVGLTLIMLGLVIALMRFERNWHSVWVIYAALAVLIPLQTGSFDSMGRFGLLAFPLLWPITAWLERGGRVRAYGTATVAVAVLLALVVQLHWIAP